MAYENDSYAREGVDNRADGTDTTALNTLIGTLIDSVEGYRKAAADTENTRFAEMFTARAAGAPAGDHHAAGGGRPARRQPGSDGTTAGAMHRGWINLKEAVLGRDDEAIVNSVESGEDYLKTKFEAVLEHKDLPAEARSAVEQAWTSVKAGHDEMSQLKHAID